MLTTADTRQVHPNTSFSATRPPSSDSPTLIPNVNQVPKGTVLRPLVPPWPPGRTALSLARPPASVVPLPSFWKASLVIALRIN